MRSDSLAGERAASKDAKAAASFNCLLLQGERGRHSHTPPHIRPNWARKASSELFSLS